MSERDDLLTLFDFVWARFTRRMDGLTDDELAWTPTPDPDLSLRWRLAHLQHGLTMDRNARWLGLPPSSPVAGPASDSVGDVLAAREAAYAAWRALVAAQDDATLALPLDLDRGPYAGSTRRSFVHHLADELVHHTADAALLRDLYGR